MINKLICADDFAITTNVSKAIIKLLEKKKINSTSCIVITNKASQNLNLLKKFNSKKGFVIGLHLTLTSFKPSTKLIRIKKFGSIASLYLNIFLNKLTKQEIKNELISQILIFKKKFGNYPKLIDGHHHIHQLPIISEILISILKELKIKNTIVRNTNIRVKDALSIKKNLYKMLLLSIFGYFFKKKLKKNNIKTNNYFLGVYDFKNIGIFKKNYEIFKKKNDFYIFMCHPGFSDKVLKSIDSVTKQREIEFEYLLKN
jgi:predicted glycoside hydrolase/deacetylase ChbG (UPF0249 family)